MSGGLKLDFLFLTDYEKWKRYAEQIKSQFFVKVSKIASSVDWKLHYAFFKPTVPAEDELKTFLKEVEEVKKNLEFLKRNFKPHNPHLLKVMEDRLNHIVEEYKKYPFSDRKSFFQARLNFIKSSINKCFVG